MTTYFVLEPRYSEMDKLWSFRGSRARIQILKHLVASAMMRVILSAMCMRGPAQEAGESSQKRGCPSGP